MSKLFGLIVCVVLTVLAVVPRAAHSAAPNFDNSAGMDVLFRNAATGEVYAWLLNGATVSNHGSMANVAASWAVQGVGDVNTDGKSDIVWRNMVSGEVVIWFVNGAVVSSFVSLGNVASTWTINGVGDINGDGRADILWRNGVTGEVYAWFLGSSGIVMSQGSLGSATSDWKIQTLADTNGDGRVDAIWRNSSSGQLVVWTLNGLMVSSWGDIGSGTPEWVIQAVADVDGDGNSDVVWRNIASGLIYVWRLNGASIAAHGSVGIVPMEWIIHQVGDVNADLKSDILFRNTTSGELYVWFMNNLSVIGQGSLGTAGHAWQVVPIRCWIGSACDSAMIPAHNNIRTSGSFGPGNPNPNPSLGNVVWNDAAAVLAQSYIAKCSWNHNPNRGGLGENLAASGFSPGTGQPPEPSASSIVGGWGAEAADYTYSSNTCAANKQCGHYTQVVWRDSTSVGCAVQYCTTNTPFGSSFPRWYIAACNYWAHGNVSGQRPY